jgi:hypothetical protein
MQASGSVKVFGRKAATCTQRILFTAHELGVDVEFEAINFATGQHKSPEYMKRQPFGKVLLISSHTTHTAHLSPACQQPLTVACGAVMLCV